MIKTLVEYLTATVEHMIKEHPEGVLLYIMGAFTITVVHLVYMKKWEIGLKGANGLFEAPEILVYIFTWLFPHMIMADQFLGLHASDWAWWFMAILLLFGLTGRFGLEWLLAFKNGTQMPKKEDEQPQPNN